jgi:serine phosphatase RsbU (regulator of sigma subunit)
MYGAPRPHQYSESPFERFSRYFSLFLLAPLLLILSLPVALHIAQKPDLGFEVHQLHIVTVVPAGPADRAGLLPGDHIIAANEQPVDSWASWYAATAGRFDLEAQRVVVERNGQELTVTILPMRPGQVSLTRDYSLWVVGLTFLLIGWWVFTRKYDPVARNFFSLCFIFAFFLLDIPDLPSVPYMTVKEHLQDLLQLLLPAFFLRFFLQFPTPARKESWTASSYRLLLLPGMTLFALTVATVYLHPAPTGSGAQKALELASLVYMLAYFLASLVIFARRALRRDRPIQRTKMVVILLGLVCGLAPFLLAVILGSLDPESVAPHVQYLAFSLLLVPASFALAIMRYGALDRAFVVRISLVYGLLTLFMLLMYFLVVVGIGFFLGRVFQVNSYPVLVLIIAASGLAILPMRRVIQGWIDQAFYPSRQANRKSVAELADQLTGLIDVEEVVQTLMGRLARLYRPQTLALYLGSPTQTGGFVPRFFSGTWEPSPESLPPEAALGRVLNRFRRPVFTEELEEILFTGESDQISLTILTRLQSSLLVPLISGNRLLGFLSFGLKNNGDLYSQEDLANLHALAVQSASVIESRQLYQESLNQKRLETELQVARDLQRKLLPEGSLSDPCFVITGRNEPCRMVGGDYFDYFMRDDGTLGVAIADVAGKGIPAALQMTSLQFAFRQVAGRSSSAREVITRLNAAVTSLVSGGGFVCFFFGIWDPATGLMNYCNAGMEPPVLFRPGVRFRQDLRKGGPVLGVDPRFPYSEGTVALQPADRLFFYTDGLTDERNKDREFFDTDRLLALVADNMESSPSHLIEKIFSTVNTFGGELKDDDKTAILLEIKKLKEKKALRSSSC